MSKDLETDSSTHDTMLRNDSTQMDQPVTAATSDLEGAEAPVLLIPTLQAILIVALQHRQAMLKSSIC